MLHHPLPLLVLQIDAEHGGTGNAYVDISDVKLQLMASTSV